MKYLLIDWDVEKELEDCSSMDDTSSLTDEEFERLAKKYGKVITSTDEFESQFNAELIDTATHQLRVVENK